MIGRIIIALWLLGEIILHVKCWGKERALVITQEAYIGWMTLLGAMLGYAVMIIGVIYW